MNMEFCWMDKASVETNIEPTRTREQVAEEDVTERAALLRRLGYTQADAVHRCLGNVAWAYSVHGTPALTPARLRKLVAAVYKGSA
jgi:hypothetical protein